MLDSTNVPDTQNQRRTLITVGLGLVALFPILKFGFLKRTKNVISCSPTSVENKTVKFLTQDGTLVEVDASKLRSVKESKGKISNEGLQDWVKKS